MRNAAWKILIDDRISALPVDVVAIARQHDITILKDSIANQLRINELGISMYNKKHWYIIYDDRQSLAEKRLTIAHELGHIFLGHPLIAGYRLCRERKKPKPESDADMFALRLLAPACVLWGLDLHNAGEIGQVCQIPEPEAQARAKRLAELYQRNKFLTSPLEKQLYQQFLSFIKNQSLSGADCV